MKIIDFRLRRPPPGFLGIVMYTKPRQRNRFTRQFGLDVAIRTIRRC